MTLFFAKTCIKIQNSQFSSEDRNSSELGSKKNMNGHSQLHLRYAFWTKKRGSYSTKLIEVFLWRNSWIEQKQETSRVLFCGRGKAKYIFGIVNNSTNTLTCLNLILITYKILIYTSLYRGLNIDMLRTIKHSLNSSAKETFNKAGHLESLTI